MPMELFWVILKAVLGVAGCFFVPIVWIGGMAHCVTRNVEGKCKITWIALMFLFPPSSCWYWFSATRKAPMLGPVPEQEQERCK